MCMCPTTLKNGAHYQLFKSKHTQGREATVFCIR